MPVLISTEPPIESARHFSTKSEYKSHVHRLLQNRLRRGLGGSRIRQAPLASLRPTVASDYVPFFWSEGYGLDGELDRAILAGSAKLKAALYDGRVFVIVPIHRTGICEEQCLYCNFRGGNKGIDVERRRLTDDELGQEAAYLIRAEGIESP
jgi:hypothetical protein